MATVCWPETDPGKQAGSDMPMESWAPHSLYCLSTSRILPTFSVKEFPLQPDKKIPNPELCDPDSDPFQGDYYYYYLNHDLDFTKRFYNHFLIPPRMTSLALNWNSPRFYFKLAPDL